MPRYQYVGISHYREITKADWESVGIHDQETVRWDRDNRRDKDGYAQFHDVSDEAARFLDEKEPAGDFVQVSSDGPVLVPGLVAGGEMIINPQPLTPPLPPTPSFNPEDQVTGEAEAKSARKVRDNPQA